MLLEWEKTMVEFEITDVDYWENDAILVYKGERHYFQFADEPSLANALRYLFIDGKIEILGENDGTP